MLLRDSPTPRLLTRELYPFGVPDDSAVKTHGDSETVRIARVDQSDRIESGHALTAAGLIVDDGFDSRNLRLDELSTLQSVERQLHSNHLERTCGNPLWQHVSFFDGSALGLKFGDFASGILGSKKSRAFIIVASIKPERIGTRYRGEPLLQTGLTEAELVTVEPIGQLVDVWKSLTNFDV